ncbi:hypothetical protein JOQ06_024608 [Pogonophryne albipinna]|uniref:Uncharacterized protein n=1 Tax=Pogonophryne albipinna TaxID=1090488 RepID=A0AAD6AAS8_9TELE|nr:hypothetical protein JOQ06_024608 [Pogonophryne albipinna]
MPLQDLPSGTLQGSMLSQSNKMNKTQVLRRLSERGSGHGVHPHRVHHAVFPPPQTPEAPQHGERERLQPVCPQQEITEEKGVHVMHFMGPPS